MMSATRCQRYTRQIRLPESVRTVKVWQSDSNLNNWRTDCRTDWRTFWRTVWLTSAGPLSVSATKIVLDDVTEMQVERAEKPKKQRPTGENYNQQTAEA